VRPRRVVRFAPLIDRRVRVLGGPAVHAACGGNSEPDLENVVKAHARLHLYYQPSPTSGWRDPSSVDSITINGWTLTVGPNTYDRAPQSRGSGPPYADFYSAGIGLACGTPAATENYDESVRLSNGHAHYGPSDYTEYALSPNSSRPC
jgi:hypothetical protein